MIALVTALLLYCAGFVFLYGVVRMSIRHALQDVHRLHEETLLADRRAALEERTFDRENAYLAGG